MVEPPPQLQGQELEDDIRKHLNIDFQSSNESQAEKSNDDNGYDNLSDYLDIEAQRDRKNSLLSIENLEEI